MVSVHFDCWLFVLVIIFRFMVLVCPHGSNSCTSFSQQTVVRFVALLKQKVTEKAPGFKSNNTVEQIEDESFLLKARVAISCFEDALTYDVDEHAVVSLSGIKQFIFGNRLLHSNTSLLQ